MLKHEFDLQIQRVSAAFPKIADGAIREIERRWLAIRPDLFARMVSCVIDHARFAPAPKDFLEAYEVESAKWQEEASAAPKVLAPFGCDDCADAVFFFCENLGRAYSAFALCAKHSKSARSFRDEHDHRSLTQEEYQEAIAQKAPEVKIRADSISAGMRQLSAQMGRTAEKWRANKPAQPSP